jgi:hypothetical protein
MSDGAAPLVRYRSVTSDSARWDGFEFRAGDIVISTPAKSGTTWTQMLCALLIFKGGAFPEPLGALSPWIDMPNRTIDDVRVTLARQRHRRFVKTHTPLDGIPIRDDVTYLVVGRDPRDIAISFHHHRANMDFERFMAQRAAAIGLADLDQLPPRPPAFDDPAESFRYFIAATEWAGPPTLANVLHHFDTAWQRRHQANVALFHFADYVADLPAELRRIASTLRIELTAGESEALAKEARLDRMRAGAERLAPGASDGHWKSPQAFFRVGGSGEWRDVATAADLAAYEARVASLVTPDLAAWAHHGRSGMRCS